MFLGFLSHSLKGMLREVPDYSAEVQDGFTLQNAAHILKVRKRLFFEGRGKELQRGQRKQKRYNFTAEHARLVFRRERERISHLR